MNLELLRSLLGDLAAGRSSVDSALERLRGLPFENLEFATVDHHRQLRCGHPEVIYCQGKSTPQVVEIARRLAADGAPVLATRASPDQRRALRRVFPDAIDNDSANAVLIESAPAPSQDRAPSTEPGVAVVCAGTSDLPVAEEAALTLRAMKIPSTRLNDVGVAGLHRLLPHVAMLQRACAVVAIAGMEGALPSVVGGLVACPVFAVPTSVGYGTNMGGLVPLLAMLNSCSSNISVVNIDNGFGAAYCASLVYQQVQKARKPGHEPAKSQ